MADPDFKIAKDELDQRLPDWDTDYVIGLCACNVGQMPPCDYCENFEERTGPMPMEWEEEWQPLAPQVLEAISVNHGAYGPLITGLLPKAVAFLPRSGHDPAIEILCQGATTTCPDRSENLAEAVRFYLDEIYLRLAPRPYSDLEDGQEVIIVHAAEAGWCGLDATVVHREFRNETEGYLLTPLRPRPDSDDRRDVWGPRTLLLRKFRHPDA